MVLIPSMLLSTTTVNMASLWRFSEKKHEGKIHFCGCGFFGGDGKKQKILYRSISSSNMVSIIREKWNTFFLLYDQISEWSDLSPPIISNNLVLSRDIDQKNFFFWSNRLHMASYMILLQNFFQSMRLLDAIHMRHILHDISLRNSIMFLEKWRSMVRDILSLSKHFEPIRYKMSCLCMRSPENSKFLSRVLRSMNISSFLSSEDPFR